LATTAPYGAETSFFSRNREPRAQCTARGAVDGALFSLYVSTVHLTRGFRAKRASGGLRRAPAPVQLRGGILSISAWLRRHMAPTSLRIYTESRFAPLVAPSAGVVSRPGCLSAKNAAPRAARSAAAQLRCSHPCDLAFFWGALTSQNHAHRTVGDAASRPRGASYARPVFFPELSVRHGGSSKVRSTRLAQCPVRCYAFGDIFHSAPYGAEFIRGQRDTTRDCPRRR